MISQSLGQKSQFSSNPYSQTQANSCEQAGSTSDTTQNSRARLNQACSNLANQPKQAGQVGIVIVLMMTVMLTVAISLSLQTSRNQQTSIDQEASTRVFNSAESGVEEALSYISAQEAAGQSIELHTIDQHDAGSGWQANIDTVDTFEMFVDQGSTVQIPLTGVSDGDEIDINWWQRTANCITENMAGIIVSVYNVDATVTPQTTVKHYGYDYCSSIRSFYETPTGTPLDGYVIATTITLANNDAYLRIMPIYNSTKLHISSNDGIMTAAQYTVSSQAEEETADVAKAIRVNRSLKGAPSFMNYALVSGGGIAK